MGPGLLSGGTQLVLQRLISFGGPNIKSGWGVGLSSLPGEKQV